MWVLPSCAGDLIWSQSLCINDLSEAAIIDSCRCTHPSIHEQGSAANHDVSPCFYNIDELIRTKRMKMGDDERRGCWSLTDGWRLSGLPESPRRVGRWGSEDRWSWVSTHEAGTAPAHHQGVIMSIFIHGAVNVLARLNRSCLVTCLSPHLGVRRTEKKHFLKRPV